MPLFDSAGTSCCVSGDGTGRGDQTCSELLTEGDSAEDRTTWKQQQNKERVLQATDANPIHGVWGGGGGLRSPLTFFCFIAEHLELSS